MANIEGGLFYERNRFYVQPLYIVTKHLTLIDSPVNFDGDVEILGDVKEGTSVHATGSVTGVYEKGCRLFRKRMECAIMVAVARMLGE